MVAVRADYRVESRHQVPPDRCVEDAKSAMRWVRSHANELGIDPSKIIAAGGSAGGHLAACTATVRGFDAEGEATAISCRPVALVLFNPVVDLTSADLVQRFDGNKQRAEQLSPGLHLTKETPPALLMYGSEDKFLAQAKQYVARCQELGVRAELDIADKQGHAFFNRSPWKERTLARAEEFLTSLGYLEGKSLIKLP
jgi:acetyl esterase/lipase